MPMVELTVTLQVEVTDEAALRAAAAAELVHEDDAALREQVLADPASCLGVLVIASGLLKDIPGVTPAGSALSAS